jgi:CDP-6-deoxy-D-xylo-4-hexulose-3-dehydrase
MGLPSKTHSMELDLLTYLRNNTFWIGVQPALTEEMPEFAASKIETYLGINF